MLIDVLNAIPESCQERLCYYFRTGETVSDELEDEDLLYLERLGIIKRKEGKWVLRYPVGYLLKRYYRQFWELLNDAS